MPNEEELNDDDNGDFLGQFQGDHYQDIAFAGNKVFIKGFSVCITIEDTVDGAHDGFDGDEYYRCFMLQNGTDPDITRDGVNRCFINDSKVTPYADIPQFDDPENDEEDGTTRDPRNYYNTYAENSLKCRWTKRNSDNYEKSHDTGWKRCMPQLLSGSTIGKGTLSDSIIVPDESHGLNRISI